MKIPAPQWSLLFMKRRYLALIAALLFLLTIALFLSWLHKNVKVVIDGVSDPISTYAVTVQDVLRHANIPL